MKIDVQNAAMQAASRIESYCYDEDGDSSFDKSRARNIIAEEMEKVVKEHLVKASTGPRGV
jgi:hypothetical protein